MSVFEFNNRPFLLKANKVSKREQQIYNLLTDSQLLAYPYEVEIQKGVHQRDGFDGVCCFGTDILLITIMVL